ncbi:ribose 5-phosphate isomerase B [Luteolibacter flavescens]|uniref:Ribose 5-phosphate isomerase B n=1 Tax=Luteolibacter flavescens TaxID=1859460 RepID=A0ABT3FVJ5_9BACT|nr:ribose 5-phosphate isomerase B [Luteolibacter flavescens]MCW1887239.1 ribose 5-phosphate isomerase B [Luteolibacter flavescens]
MKIAIGSDHAGFSYKREIIAQLRARDITVIDVGTDSEAPVSYVPFIREVALGVAEGKYSCGIVLGGSGNGEAMAANRIKGVRCALCWNVETAKLARQHNDANVLSLGERVIDLRTALAIVDTFLATHFEGGRHVERIHELDA